MSSGEQSSGELSDGELSSGKLSNGEVFSGELSGDELSSGELSGDEVVNAELSGGELSALPNYYKPFTIMLLVLLLTHSKAQTLRSKTPSHVKCLEFTPRPPTPTPSLMFTWAYLAMLVGMLQ